MTAYIRRLWPTTKVVAATFAAIAGIRFLINLAAGEVRGGSPLNIVLRIVGAVAILFAVSFIIKAVHDWYERRSNQHNKRKR